MRRRRFLAAFATGGLAALAGCSGPNGSLRLTLVDDDVALAEQYTSPVDGLPPAPRDFLASVIEEGSGTWEDTHPPLDRTRPVEYEGGYYRYEYEVVETRTEQIYTIDVDYDPEGPVDGPTVAYEDLPDVDRAAVDDLFPPPEDPPTGEGYDVGVGHRYPPDAESALVPDQRYDAVSYEGTAYPIRVGEGRAVDVHTYRYTATQVAADAAELAAAARGRYRFALSGLPDEERAIVESAIEETYRIESDDDPPEAFESLLDRFRAREAIERDEYGGEWLTRYEGSDYWADVGFPYDESDSTPPEDVPSVTPPPEGA